MKETHPFFKEKISPFLRKKISEFKENYGEHSTQYIALSLQYIRGPLEAVGGNEANIKHYEAGVHVEIDHSSVPGLERLYKRTLVIEPTLICASHCRYCLRQNYSKHTLTEAQLFDIAKYCGEPERRDILNEVLITGGDPLLLPQRMNILIQALLTHAPNIKTVRIGTRLMTQSPDKFDSEVFSLFKDKPGIRFEIATQLNHPAEFFPETCEIFKRLQGLGIKIYSQNVLLKGINDNVETLIELYNEMRLHDIEAHYLFHCVPIRGIHHLRTSVDKGLELMRCLSSGGFISGRAKPMYAAMTDIGKIVFYEGTIASRKDGWLLLKSGYRLKDRFAWNPTWRLPENAATDEAGFLQVWYLDGDDGN